LKRLDLLRAIYTSRLTGGNATLATVSRRLDSEADELRKEISESARAGLLKKVGGSLELTDRGRARLKVVMIGGAFELIHPGHVYTMEAARRLGNTLVVVVATDETIARNKKRDPITNQGWRVRLTSQVRLVDAAVPGGRGSIYDTLERVRPDIVALGYDQSHNPEDIVKEAARRGLKISVVRLGTPIPLIKTSKIVESL
jgi:FAD synthetase